MLSLVLFIYSVLAHDGSIVNSEPNALRYGIDISVWQSTFDGSKAKANGVKLVMCRAGFATTKDKCWDAFTASAMKNGLELGAYHFATFHFTDVSPDYNAALANAKTQANWFLSVLKTVKINSYVALDFEMQSGHTMNLNAAQATECILAYLNIIKNAGYKPILYSGASMLYSSVNVTKIMQQYPLWCAYYFKYGTAMDFPMWDGSFPNTTWGKRMQAWKSGIKMWQFTSEGYAKKYGCGGTNLDKSYLYF
ncbi:putative Glycosyl hydrolase [Monocercomonoides exilis]|uniref:putative Glycosyl hydrolase n=1 Tax=Monocercomonoides exilis TaxID=2049356 RepID=UPI00355A3D16|nr:putative Glycosyl hydrolase [Monocercomonoides exilis]|eukprot:MONOS_1156.1-p1 / transcript=MONOS_1156.1 / gene=MONOS_1156 / organism=Monocercomonoides_exilis_PA203 / gene_product=Glycosyl hydrolase / transcript_product=Glycosyl hydrolase / location=Mono_scaffold00019:206126-206878(-) / protein_length=251 / sequence_SO=supercontig / SO=protein_coding / is_pseudo=false